MEKQTNYSANFEVAEVQISYQRKYNIKERPQLASSKSAYNLLLEIWDDSKIEHVEEMKLILLNNSLQVLGISNISTGGMTGTVCDPRVIFAIALKTAATRIMIAHNHPSGNLKPSKLDDTLTEKIKQGGQTLEIQLIDHLIITKDGFLSYADEGIL